MRYLYSKVTTREVPEEISLTIAISGCPIRCPQCHSKELWEDRGEVLDTETINTLISKEPGITCVCLMGGDGRLDELKKIICFIRKTYKDLKIAWYSGNDWIDDEAIYDHLDYFKVGPYREECGSLDNPKTNQRMYKVSKVDYNDGAYITTIEDITKKFQKKDM